MDIRSAYNQWSDSYDADENRTRDLERDVTRRRLGGLRFESILEIGCGTGKNTSFLCGIGERVLAVDFSQGMLEKAQEKVRADNVRFMIMDITRPWELESGSFSLIVCSLVLEHVEDLSRVFSEAARTLRPGGKLLIDELHPFRQYEGKKARFYRDREKVEVDAFVHHISDFLSAAAAAGLELTDLDEHWHEQDQNKPPRLLSLTFERR